VVIANDTLLPVPYPIPYPPARQPFLEANIQYMDLGMLAIICFHCHTLHFDCEKLTFLRVNHSKFGICYLQRQIQLFSFQLLTGILHNYLTRDDYFLRDLVGVKINNLVTR